MKFLLVTFRHYLKHFRNLSNILMIKISSVLGHLKKYKAFKMKYVSELSKVLQLYMDVLNKKYGWAFQLDDKELNIRLNDSNLEIQLSPSNYLRITPHSKIYHVITSEDGDSLELIEMDQDTENKLRDIVLNFKSSLKQEILVKY